MATTYNRNRKTFAEMVREAGLGDDAHTVLLEMRQSMTLDELCKFWKCGKNKIVNFLQECEKAIDFRSGVKRKQFAPVRHGQTKTAREHKSDLLKQNKIDDVQPRYICNTCCKSKTGDLMRTLTDCKQCAVNRARSRV